MKILFWFAALLILFSCNNGKDKMTTRLQNSVASKQAKIDSLKQVPIDSLQKIAWGDLRFGISEKEASCSQTFKNSIQNNEDEIHLKFKILANYSSNPIIDCFSSVEAYFYKDRLYRMDLGTKKIAAKLYDSEIKETAFRIKELIESNNGRAANQIKIPRYSDLKPGKPITVYSWLIGEKRISVNINALASGSEYELTCIVINTKEAKEAIENGY